MTTILDYFPHLGLRKIVLVIFGSIALFGIISCFWLGLTTGVVHKHGKDYKREEQPFTFWSIVGFYGLVIACVIAVFVMYLVKGMR